MLEPQDLILLQIKERLTVELLIVNFYQAGNSAIKSFKWLEKKDLVDYLDRCSINRLSNILEIRSVTSKRFKTHP